MKRAMGKPIAEPNGNARQRREELPSDFIRIELELADTYCNLARESHSAAKALQHRFNARRAMDAALNALTKVKINTRERDAILAKLESLKSRLGGIEQHS